MQWVEEHALCLTTINLAGRVASTENVTRNVNAINPGRLLYALLLMDIDNSLIYMAISAEEENGHLSHKATWRGLRPVTSQRLRVGGIIPRSPVTPGAGTTEPSNTTTLKRERDETRR